MSTKIKKEVLEEVKKFHNIAKIIIKERHLHNSISNKSFVEDLQNQNLKTDLNTSDFVIRTNGRTKICFLGKHVVLKFYVRYTCSISDDIYIYKRFEEEDVLPTIYKYSKKDKWIIEEKLNTFETTPNEDIYETICATERNAAKIIKNLFPSIDIEDIKADLKSCSEGDLHKTYKVDEFNKLKEFIKDSGLDPDEALFIYNMGYKEHDKTIMFKILDYSF